MESKKNKMLDYDKITFGNFNKYIADIHKRYEANDNWYYNEVEKLTYKIKNGEEILFEIPIMPPKFALFNKLIDLVQKSEIELIDENISSFIAKDEYGEYVHFKEIKKELFILPTSIINKPGPPFNEQEVVQYFNQNYPQYPLKYLERQVQIFRQGVNNDDHYWYVLSDKENSYTIELCGVVWWSPHYGIQWSGELIIRVFFRHFEPTEAFFNTSFFTLFEDGGKKLVVKGTSHHNGFYRKYKKYLNITAEIDADYNILLRRGRELLTKLISEGQYYKYLEYFELFTKDVSLRAPGIAFLLKEFEHESSPFHFRNIIPSSQEESIIEKYNLGQKSLLFANSIFLELLPVYITFNNEYFQNETSEVFTRRFIPFLKIAIKGKGVIGDGYSEILEEVTYDGIKNKWLDKFSEGKIKGLIEHSAMLGVIFSVLDILIIGGKFSIDPSLENFYSYNKQFIDSAQQVIDLVEKRNEKLAQRLSKEVVDNFELMRVLNKRAKNAVLVFAIIDLGLSLKGVYGEYKKNDLSVATGHAMLGVAAILAFNPVGAAASLALTIIGTMLIVFTKDGVLEKTIPYSPVGNIFNSKEDFELDHYYSPDAKEQFLWLYNYNGLYIPNYNMILSSLQSYYYMPMQLKTEKDYNYIYDYKRFSIEISEPAPLYKTSFVTFKIYSENGELKWPQEGETLTFIRLTNNYPDYPWLYPGTTATDHNDTLYDGDRITSWKRYILALDADDTHKDGLIPVAYWDTDYFFMVELLNDLKEEQIEDIKNTPEKLLFYPGVLRDIVKIS